MLGRVLAGVAMQAAPQGLALFVALACALFMVFALCINGETDILAVAQGS